MDESILALGTSDSREVIVTLLSCDVCIWLLCTGHAYVLKHYFASVDG